MLRRSSRTFAATPGRTSTASAFAFAEGPDPRNELAASDDLDDGTFAAIRTKLARLDKASAIGPWTEQTLRLVAANRAVRAGDLCLQVGREMAPFKLDVRKLKNLGLTISLGTGYEISPRGATYLRVLERTRDGTG